MKLIKVLFIIVGLLESPIAAANTYFCTGKVDYFQVSASGYLSVSGSDLYGDIRGISFCNVSSVWKSVTVESCDAWTAMILTAKTTNSDIKIQYGDDLTCATQPTWSNSSAPISIKLL